MKKARPGLGRAMKKPGESRAPRDMDRQRSGDRAGQLALDRAEDVGDLATEAGQRRDRDDGDQSDEKSVLDEGRTLDVLESLHFFSSFNERAAPAAGIHLRRSSWDTRKKSKKIENGKQALV